jgi:hypothetical protein
MTTSIKLYPLLNPQTTRVPQATTSEPDPRSSPQRLASALYRPTAQSGPPRSTAAYFHPAADTTRLAYPSLLAKEQDYEHNCPLYSQVPESAAHPAMYKRPGSGPPYSGTWAAGSIMQSESCLRTTHTWGCRARQEAVVVVSVAAGLPR